MRRQKTVGAAVLVVLALVIAAAAHAPARKTAGRRIVGRTVVPSSTARRAGLATLVPTQAPYWVAISGDMPVSQQVGRPVQLLFTLRNFGQDIRDFVVEFSGLEHWTVNGITGPNQRPALRVGPGDAYSVGPVPRSDARAPDIIAMQLTPRDAGDWTLSVRSYHDFDRAHGRIDPGAAIAGGTDQEAATISYVSP